MYLCHLLNSSAYLSFHIKLILCSFLYICVVFSMGFHRSGQEFWFPQLYFYPTLPPLIWGQHTWLFPPLFYAWIFWADRLVSEHDWPVVAVQLWSSVSAFCFQQSPRDKSGETISHEGMWGINSESHCGPQHLIFRSLLPPNMRTPYCNNSLANSSQLLDHGRSWMPCCRNTVYTRI